MASASEMNIENPVMLLAYLRDSGRISPAECPSFVTLAGGVSNRTVWVRHQGRDDWVLKQALEKLRVKVDCISNNNRQNRGACVISAPASTVAMSCFHERVSQFP